MRHIHVRRTAALSLAMAGTLAGVGLGVPAYAATSGTITGNVFVDSNRNGAFDAGEGVISQTVTLFGPGSLEIGTTETDPQGQYTFSDLTADGDYTVKVTPNSGFTAPADATVTMDISAAVADPLVATQNMQLTFGAVTAASVSGTVFLDGNFDGSWADSEMTLGGRVVDLLDADGNVVARADTNAEGMYTFTNVAPGTYTMAVTRPNTLPATVSVTVAATDVTRDIPMYGGAVAGVVFEDLNEDGILDDGEPGIAGVPVRVTLPGGPVTVASGPDGTYSVGVAEAGEYSVSATAPTGQRITSTNPATVTVPAGEIANVHMGVAGTAVVDESTFNITTFYDVDGDGTLDTGEAPIGPVAFVVTDSDGAEVGRDSTKDDGTFTTPGLPAGTYTVTFTAPDGTVATSATTVTVVLPGTGTAPTATFGFTELATYDGLVFIDTNNNKQHDAGEKLIAGATVVLTGAGGTYTATTDANGAYSIADIKPGDYTVTVTLPDQYKNDVDSLVYTTTDQIRGGDRITVDYFIGGKTVAQAATGALTGRIYIDANKNKVFDTGETPLAGTKIVLKHADGTEYSAVADAEGKYSFERLPVGKYTVTVTIPDAYKDKVANPTYTASVDITADTELVSDFFISGAVTPTTPKTSTANKTTGGTLANTGTDAAIQAGFAGGLIALGGALLSLRRRFTA